MLILTTIKYSLLNIDFKWKNILYNNIYLNRFTDLILDKEHTNTLEYCDNENKSITESEISATNVSPLIGDIDHNSDDDEVNYKIYSERS